MHVAGLRMALDPVKFGSFIIFKKNKEATFNIIKDKNDFKKSLVVQLNRYCDKM
jgi:hypothetical protein